MQLICIMYLMHIIVHICHVLHWCCGVSINIKFHCFPNKMFSLRTVTLLCWRHNVFVCGLLDCGNKEVICYDMWFDKFICPFVTGWAVWSAMQGLPISNNNVVGCLLTGGAPPCVLCFHANHTEPHWRMAAWICYNIHVTWRAILTDIPYQWFDMTPPLSV